MTYVFVAYGVIWALIFGYTLSVSRQQRQLAVRVESLRQLVDSEEQSRIANL